MDDYVIDQLSWHTSRTKRRDLHDRALLHMKTIVEFLQHNNLVKYPLYREGDPIDGSFCFRKSDLTDEGFRFIQKYYDKWLASHDRGKDVSDTRLLLQSLKKMREND